MLLDETLDGESAAGNHADKLISAFVFSIFLFLLSGGGVGGAHYTIHLYAVFFHSEPQYHNRILQHSCKSLFSSF